LITWINPEAELLALAAASWGAWEQIKARIADDMTRCGAWQLEPMERFE
jgi:hypothetical protein